MTMTGSSVCVLMTLVLIGTSLPAAPLTSPATVEELTAMATQQALTTWKPVEISNGLYLVKVTPISKTSGGGCLLLHRVIRKQGKIVRDHTLRVCPEGKQ
jgi:hypothetical protein